MIKINGYNENQLNYITENYNTKTVNEIAFDLQKSSNSITYVARKLGLIKQPHKAWTDAEIKFLKENYMNMSSEEMANHLNKTVPSINARCDELGLIKHDAWTENELEYLRDNFDKYEYEEIGNYLGRTESAVRAKCFELNLYKKEIPWTEKELNFLKENYMQMSKNEIGEILNRSPSAISLKASRMGFKKYPYYCDYHYFDNIDTEEKAYWLGFLTADGWINKNEKSNAGAVGIELQYGDIGHLKKFNKSIGGNYQITDRWRTEPLKLLNGNKLNKQVHTCIIRIFSLIMYNSLVNLGFSAMKSYDCFIPKLSQELYRHFMRGYFDGDGCFCLTDKSFGVSFVTASEQLNTDILVLIRKQGIDIKEYTHMTDYDTKLFCPVIHRIKDKIKFLDWIYSDCNIYLDRKYKKYKKAKEKYSTS